MTYGAQQVSNTTGPFMLVRLNRKGRKRKAGPRYPSGGLAKQSDDPMAIALHQPHRRDLPVIRDSQGKIVTDMRRDQKAECGLGRMRIARLITQGQYDAGVKYRAMHLLWRAALASRDSLARFSAGSGRVVADEEDQRRVAKYEAALGCMDRRSSHAVGLVVLRDQHVTADKVVEVRRGLMQLARHLGITDEPDRRGS